MNYTEFRNEDGFSRTEQTEKMSREGTEGRRRCPFVPGPLHVGRHRERGSAVTKTFPRDESINHGGMTERCWSPGGCKSALWAFLAHIDLEKSSWETARKRSAETDGGAR
jgi:hypothetical protein